MNTQYTKSYFWLFPKRDSVWLGVGGTIKGGGAVLLTERLNELIQSRDDLRGHAIRHRGAGLVPSDRAAKLVADGPMVVGDAGGLVNPMTGSELLSPWSVVSIAGRVAASAIAAGRTDRGFLAKYLRRVCPHPSIPSALVAMEAWRRQLDRKSPDQQPAAYARMLRQYLSFFHRALPTGRTSPFGSPTADLWLVSSAPLGHGPSARPCGARFVYDEILVGVHHRQPQRRTVAVHDQKALRGRQPRGSPAIRRKSCSTRDLKSSSSFSFSPEPSVLTRRYHSFPSRELTN